ncbi:regulatory protein RecX [Citrobacter sp. JGM124]|uniref:regulatory protein RecX n=1 Tax=Citrobacter sp. JGM124 TaxID=2799789 RepID=UPI001BA6D6AF|nr:regulatory protein RecX [Citrobacter sp. JGM124]MBS0848805.1 regulatory protein RecX [Citrobacter sp. JGM124]
MPEPLISSLRTVFARLCDRAVRILAMRDHSEQELRRKLTMPVRFTSSGQQQEKTEYSQEEIEKVIDWCYQQNWLDDRQFATRFIASRSRKGYGPQSIRQALQQKGIDRENREAAMCACEIDWSNLALETAERKFGAPLPQEWQKRIKVQRFLLYRGFFMEDIQNIY